jgi:type I restriction enzyme S subunit
MRVRAPTFTHYPLWLPPLAEQHRIVAEIEKQFTRLDASVAALKRAQANLKRYRASVLKAACEGKLVPTEADLARAECRDYEPAGQLLERILAERRALWEAQENRRGKYKEPLAPDMSELPELSEGWVWSYLDQLITLLRNGYSKRPQGTAGTAILRISAVRAMGINLEDVRWVGDLETVKDFLIQPGDVLFTRYNGNPGLVGACGMVPNLTRDTMHPDKLIRASLVKNGALPEFVQIVANVGRSREFLTQRIRTTAGQSGISGSDLRVMPLPLPPIAEQHRIVAEVERRLSVIQQAEATVAANLKRAERLRQSILKQAFSGQLVPQDPNDEPASVLLERIRAEREAAQATQAAAKPPRPPRRGKSKQPVETQLALPEETA